MCAWPYIIAQTVAWGPISKMRGPASMVASCNGAAPGTFDQRGQPVLPFGHVVSRTAASTAGGRQAAPTGLPARLCLWVASLSCPRANVSCAQKSTSAWVLMQPCSIAEWNLSEGDFRLLLVHSISGVIVPATQCIPFWFCMPCNHC